MSKIPTHHGEFYRLSYAVYYQGLDDESPVIEQMLELCYSQMIERLPGGYGRMKTHELEFTLLTNANDGTNELTVITGIIEPDGYEELRAAFRGGADSHTLAYFVDEEAEPKQLLLRLAGSEGFGTFLKRYDALLLALHSDVMATTVGTYAIDVEKTKPKNGPALFD